MSKYDPLGLVFEDPTRDPVPSSARASIYLKTYTTGPVHGFGKDDVHALTPFEYHPDQFDAHADRRT